MCLQLVGSDVTDPVGYLVAIERNQFNVNTINNLSKLDDGCDSIKKLTPDNIKGLLYHY